MISPIVYTQLNASAENNWQPRPESILKLLSSEPADFIHTPWPQNYGLPDFAHAGSDDETNNAELRPGVSWRRLSPGVMKYGLAIIGLLWCAFQNEGPYRRWMMFCVTVSTFAFLMSMGLKLQIGDFQPARWVMAHLPGHSHTRSIFRYTYLVQVCIGLMAAFGLHGLFVMTRQLKLNAVPIVTVVIVGLVAATEVTPAAQKTYPLPSRVAQPAWVDWLASHTPEGTPVACVPFSTGKTVFHYVRTTKWMYWTCFHRRPILNGYTSQTTAAYRELRDSMISWAGEDDEEMILEFPDEKTLTLMYDMGARYVVIQRSWYTRKDIEAEPICKDVLVHQFADDAGKIDIYRLVSRPKAEKSEDAAP